MIPPDPTSCEDQILTVLDAFQTNFVQAKQEKHTFSLPQNQQMPAKGGAPQSDQDYLMFWGCEVKYAYFTLIFTSQYMVF